MSTPAQFKKIQSIFSDVLQRSEENITPEKTIFVDLEVESVEALELEFSLEEAFDFTIGEKDLWKLPSYLTANNMITDGRLNNEAKILVRGNFKGMSDDSIDAISNPNELYTYLTVEDVALYVEKIAKDAA